MQNHEFAKYLIQYLKAKKYEKVLFLGSHTYKNSYICPEYYLSSDRLISIKLKGENLLDSVKIITTNKRSLTIIKNTSHQIDSDPQELVQYH